MSLPESVNEFQMLLLVQICEWAVSDVIILDFYRVGPALILGKSTCLFDEKLLGCMAPLLSSQCRSFHARSPVWWQIKATNSESELSNKL